MPTMTTSERTPGEARTGPGAGASGPGTARPARRPPQKQASGAGDGEVRKFGLVMLVGFGLIGAVLFWRGRVTAAAVLAGLGVAVCLLSLASPAAARPVRRAWMALAHVLGRINTTIILSALYFVLFGAIALVFRVIGRDALGLRFDRTRTTYFEPKRRSPDARTYFDQF